jgi:hypothetical protein
MAPAKTVIISVTTEDTKENLTLTFKRVTEAKISEELDSDIVKTFDEPVTVPSSDGGYSVDISALEARSIADFILLKRILKNLKTTPGSLTISETVKYSPDQIFDDVNFLSGVTLTSNEVTYSAEDLTARDLSFKAKSLEETVNGEPII